MTTEPLLLPHELESSVWKKLKEHLDAELIERRTYNDGESLDAVATAMIRGEIKHIKRMLRIGILKPEKQTGT